MSDDDFEALIGRVQAAGAVLAMSNAGTQSPPARNGYGGLTEKKADSFEEIASFRKEVMREMNAGKAESKVIREQIPMGNSIRVLDMTLDELNRSIEDGRIAFRYYILLYNAAFAVGLILLLLAGIAGLFLQREFASFVFGGIGILIIAGIFFMKPNEEIQRSLSNILQAQAVFVDYSNQLPFWAPYAKDVTSMEEKRQASQSLHDATTFALKAIQDYIEVPTKA